MDETGGNSACNYIRDNISIIGTKKNINIRSILKKC